MHIHKKALIGAVFLSVLSLGTAFAQEAPQSVSLDLNKAVRMALENNSDVKISSSELDAAKAGLDAARAARWGSIDFAHSTGRNMRYKTAAGATLATGPVGTNSSTNTVSISVPIYTGGKLEGQIEEAKANQKYYEYGMNSAYQTTRYNAAKGYYDVLESINTVNLQKETVDRLAEHLRNTQSQFNVGVSAKVDVLRSQVELVDAQQTLTQAQNSYDVAVATLNNVLGLPTGTPLSLSEGLEYKPNDYTLDNCLSYAMLNRPEIHQAQASVDMAKAEQKIANAATLPQVSLSAANGWADDRFPGAHKYEWSVGASGTMASMLLRSVRPRLTSSKLRKAIARSATK